MDARKVRNYLKNFLPKLEKSCRVCLIETHTMDTIPKDLVDLCIVLTCSTEQLYDRLMARNYKPNKVEENIECEIMGIVLEEATNRFPSVISLKSNHQDDIQDNVEAILESIL
jgi:adenylate kinase